MAKEKSLFQIGEYLIDLEQIVWIKLSARSVSKVRFGGADISMEFPDDDIRALQAAWVAYKGRFVPAKER